MDLVTGSALWPQVVRWATLASIHDLRGQWPRIIDRRHALQQVPSLNGSAVNLVLVQLGVWAVVAAPRPPVRYLATG